MEGQEGQQGQQRIVTLLQQQQWFVTFKWWFKTITDFVSFFMKVGAFIGFIGSMISLEIKIMIVNLRNDMDLGFENLFENLRKDMNSGDETKFFIRIAQKMVVGASTLSTPPQHNYGSNHDL
ncbi:hypothetical protein C1645_820016 [Glomus cerebriforme]|uniref:Uncharacterized protein n=1 Tax=Glomus cerebriforme TaxID=658196 RepID=A0A397T456_9GLOM|nr:hypothetical protein C1645_820016 [Glomus cerebriforme]